MFVQGDAQKRIIAKAALQSKLSNDGLGKTSKGALYEGNVYFSIQCHRSILNFVSLYVVKE